MRRGADDPLVAFLAQEVGATGASRRDIARDLGWPADSVSDILTGRVTLLLEHFLALADWLQLPPEQLIARYATGGEGGEEADSDEEEATGAASEGEPAAAEARPATTPAQPDARQTLQQVLADLRFALRHALERHGAPPAAEPTPQAPHPGALAANSPREEVAVELLHDLILAAGLTPLELSHRMGRSATYLHRVLHRNRGAHQRLRMQSVEEILQALGEPIAPFFGTLSRKLRQPTVREDAAPPPRPDSPRAIVQALFHLIAEETGRTPVWPAAPGEDDDPPAAG